MDPKRNAQARADNTIEPAYVELMLREADTRTEGNTVSIDLTPAEATVLARELLGTALNIVVPEGVVGEVSVSIEVPSK